MDDNAVDFAVAAWREDGLWQVVCCRPTPRTRSTRSSARCARSRARAGSLGLVSVAEEFFLLTRVLGDDVRLLLSDLFAAEDWPLGLDALDRLGVPSPEDDETDDVAPVGDLRLVEDFGLSRDEMELILDDPEAWPDELLAAIAHRLGFGEQFDLVLEQLPD